MIGFGTGRCGTTSLAKIINGCKNVSVSHESYAFRVDWYRTSKRRIRRMANTFRRYIEEDILVGDVALYWLPHIGSIRAHFPNIKLVHIFRNKEEVANSFLRKSDPPADRLRPERKTGQRVRLGDHMFPTIDGFDLRQSYEFYWEMYQKWAKSISNVYHLDVYQLNNKKALVKLFDYLEIPERDRVFPERTRFNKGPQ